MGTGVVGTGKMPFAKTLSGHPSWATGLVGTGLVGTGVAVHLVATPSDNSYWPPLVGHNFTSENLQKPIGIRPSTLAIL